jgi:hypothetical protein
LLIKESTEVSFNKEVAMEELVNKLAFAIHMEICRLLTIENIIIHHRA